MKTRDIVLIALVPTILVIVLIIADVTGKL